MGEQVERLVQKALGKQDKTSVVYDSSSSEFATEVIPTEESYFVVGSVITSKEPRSHCSTRVGLRFVEAVTSQESDTRTHIHFFIYCCVHTGALGSFNWPAHECEA